MKMIYPAVFYPYSDNSGGYVVEFPDLPGCVTGGKNLEEAMEMAVDAASGWVLDELEECVSGNNDVESEIERQELQKKINVFLMGLPRRECHVFICRYWYMNSISDIAKQFNYSESKIKSLLFRTRDKLRIMLEKEGY